MERTAGVELVLAKIDQLKPFRRRSSTGATILNQLAMSQHKIVSYTKLNPALRNRLRSLYPDGFEGRTFNLRLPTSRQVYRMVSMESEGVHYMVKIGLVIEGYDLN